MVMCIVKVICDANGHDTPHDGKYVEYWCPHTKAGVCEVETTEEKAEALIFISSGHALAEWRTVSNVEPTRPWDGKPNRPLTGLTIETEAIDEVK